MIIKSPQNVDPKTISKRAHNSCCDDQYICGIGQLKLAWYWKIKDSKDHYNERVYDKGASDKIAVGTKMTWRPDMSSTPAWKPRPERLWRRSGLRTAETSSWNHLNLMILDNYMKLWSSICFTSRQRLLRESCRYWNLV